MSGDIREGGADVRTGTFRPSPGSDDIRQGLSDVRGSASLDPLMPSTTLFPSPNLYPQ